MINNRLIYTSIFLSGTILLILIILPQLDLGFSNLFYKDTKGFIYKNNYVVKFLFLSIPILTKFVFLLSLLLILHNFIRNRKLKNIFLTHSFFIIITIIIGPGFIVNYVFKNNLFARARPVQIENFGGNKIFSPALSLVNQCKHNCSFSSGHAAMGYYFTNLAYIAPGVYFVPAYVSAIVFGSLVGFSRILTGGHFLSDVIASCFTILIINHLLYLIRQKTLSLTSNKT